MIQGLHKLISDEHRVERLGGDRNDSVVPGDLPKLTASAQVVFDLLSDHLWHDGPEIQALGIEDPKRRLREIRGLGFQIENQRIAGKRSWRYRMLPALPSLPPDFLAYYQSDAWRVIKARIAERDGHKCVNPKCGRRSGLVCHHLTYVRFGRELDCDLVTLCSICHEAAHVFGQRNNRLAKMLDRIGGEWIRLPALGQQATLF